MARKNFERAISTSPSAGHERGIIHIFLFRKFGKALLAVRGAEVSTLFCVPPRVRGCTFRGRSVRGKEGGAMRAAALLALGCAAGAGAWWWWNASSSKADAPGAPQPAEESPACPVREERADASSVPAAVPVPTRVRQQRQAPAPPPPPASGVALPPGAAAESSSPETTGVPAPPTPKTGPERRKELVAAAARRKAASAEAAPAPDQQTQSHAQPGASVPEGAARRAHADDDAARATAAWAAMHAKGWQCAAAAAEECASRAPRAETWVSCRAARAANSKRTAAGAADGDDIDFENGVWSVEDEDRYSGAGGRGVSAQDSAVALISMVLVGACYVALHVKKKTARESCAKPRKRTPGA